MILDAGSAVPADGRLIEAVNLEVEEATLTGESEPVAKTSAPVYETERAIADRRNVLYMGTTVTRGRASLLVTATGMATELGRIADLIQSVQDEQTPLQRRLEVLAWAEQQGALIFEDDYDSEFRYSGRPVEALQGLERVGVDGPRRGANCLFRRFGMHQLTYG